MREKDLKEKYINYIKKMATINEIIKQELIEKKQIKKDKAKIEQLIEDIKFSATPDFNLSLTYKYRRISEINIIKKLKKINNEFLIETIRQIIKERSEYNGFTLTSSCYRKFLEQF